MVARAETCVEEVFVDGPFFWGVGVEEEGERVGKTPAREFAEQVGCLL